MKKVSLSNDELIKFLKLKRFVAKSKVHPEGVKYFCYGEDEKVEEPYNIRIVEEDTKNVSYVEAEWFNQRRIYIPDEMEDECAFILKRQWEYINRFNKIKENYACYKDHEYLVFKYYDGIKFISATDVQYGNIMLDPRGIWFKISYDYGNDMYDILAEKIWGIKRLFTSKFTGMGVEQLDLKFLLELVESEIKEDFEKVWTTLNNDSSLEKYEFKFSKSGEKFVIHYTDRKFNPIEDILVEVSPSKKESYMYDLKLSKSIGGSMIYMKEFSSLFIEDMYVLALLQIAENEYRQE